MVKHYSFALGDEVARKFDMICLKLSRSKSRVLEDLVIKFVKKNGNI